MNAMRPILLIEDNPSDIKLALHAFAEQGYGVYRTSTAFAEKVAATYGPVKREVERRLKKALDPNNILAPGRCGISL